MLKHLPCIVKQQYNCSHDTYPNLILVRVCLISPEYKTSYLKQAVTSLPHQSSIYSTEDPTNHITKPGRCHGNFSTHARTHTHTQEACHDQEFIDHLPLAVQLASQKIWNADFRLPSKPHTFWKHFSTHKTAHLATMVTSCWILSFTSCNECRLFTCPLSLSVSHT